MNNNLKIIRIPAADLISIFTTLNAYYVVLN